MSDSDPNDTFLSYTGLMLVAGVVATSQIGITGVLMSAAAIYSGACFMSGYLGGDSGESGESGTCSRKPRPRC
jgi:hypothetical protein